jgi:hypothetical protein
VLDSSAPIITSATHVLDNAVELAPLVLRMKTREDGAYVSHWLVQMYRQNQSDAIGSEAV